jgi:hypothetical protein
VLDKRLSKTISFIFSIYLFFAPDMKHNVFLFKGNAGILRKEIGIVESVEMLRGT